MTQERIRFHLDEHVSPAIAHGLRQRGIDVTTTVEADLLNAADSQHIAFALREGRVIFTNDRDFLRVYAEGVEHAGIAYCHQQSRSVGEMIRMLVLMFECLTAEEMKGQIEYI